MADYSKFVNNPSYYNTSHSFGKPRPQEVGGTRYKPVRIDTGAFLQENGDIRFYLFEPKATTIEIVMQQGHTAETLALQKNSEGFFEGTWVNNGDPRFIGKRGLTVKIDGVACSYYRIPRYYRGNKLTNYVDFPDPEWDDYLIKDVPHGTLAFETYWSDTVGGWQRCMVYTPAEYRHNTDKKYPVMYLHHGWGENETSWMFAAKVPQIMDNLIAEGRAEPFIVVTNENMPKLPSDGSHGMDGYTSVLLNDCISFIEREYRCIPDKWHRGIGGNSYGGMMTSVIGFGHPEMFSHLGIFSGGFRFKDLWQTYEENHHLDWLYNNAEEIGKTYTIIYRGHGTGEYSDVPDNSDDEVFCRENGIDALPCYKRHFIKDGYHEWDTFGKEFAQFAQYAFKG